MVIRIVDDCMVFSFTNHHNAGPERGIGQMCQANPFQMGVSILGSLIRLNVPLFIFYQTADKREFVSEEYWLRIDFASRIIAVALLLAKFLRPFVFL